MKLNFYCIYDTAIAAYMRPFVMQSDGQAVRQFTDEAMKAETPINAHPEDYALFRVGMFDDQKGAIIAEEPTCLARAHEVMAIAQQVDGSALETFDKMIDPITDKVNGVKNAS